MWVIKECTTEAVLEGIVETINEYEKRRQEMFAVRDEWSWLNVCKTLNKYYQNVLKIDEKYDSARTRQLYINTYDNI
jgi:hypothetical protein